MLAMVLPSGALPAPLIIAAVCLIANTIALTSAGFAGMARSYATNRPILWKIIANRRTAGVSTDFFRAVQKRVRAWGDQVGALAGQEEGGQERDHI